MDELQRYIDVIFADYLHCPQARRLRDRLLRKIQIRLEKKLSLNMGAATAMRELQGELAHWTAGLEGCRLVFVSGCRQACWQKVLQKLIVMWVFSLPLIVLCSPWGAVVCICAAVLMCFAALMALYGYYRVTDKVAFVNVRQAKRRACHVWIGWAVFYCCAVIMIRFFSGKIDHSNGSFVLAQRIARYYAPLLTIVFPLLASDIYYLLGYYDVAGEDEDELSED